MNDAELRALPESAKRRLRFVTNQLTAIGFRPGAPIQRAVHGFSLNDLMASLLTYHRKDKLAPKRLVLTTADGDQVLFCVDGVRSYNAMEPPTDDTMFGEMIGSNMEEILFPQLVSERGALSSNHWFIVDGSLVVDVDHPTVPGSDYVRAATSWSGEDLDLAHVYECTRISYGNVYLRTLAIVAFDEHGQFVTALVQRVPSPLDQVLDVPPL